MDFDKLSEGDHACMRRFLFNYSVTFIYGVQLSMAIATAKASRFSNRLIDRGLATARRENSHQNETTQKGQAKSL